MALREILATFGFDVDDRKLKEANKSVDGLAAKMKGALAVVGGAAILGGIKTFVQEMINAEGAVVDTAAALGVSAKELQAWQFVGKKAGAEAADVANAIKILSKNAGDAKGESRFKEIGVAIKDASGELKPISQLMRETGLALGAIKSPAERTNKALEILGKGGSKLLPAFIGGAEGVDKLLALFDELGGGLGPEALEVLGEAGDLTDEMELSVTSLKARLATALFPTINAGIQLLTKWISAFSRSSQAANLLKATVTVLGSAAAIAGAKMIAPFIPFILLVGAAVLILEDLTVAFEGGDSAVGRFVDSLFGAGATEEIVDDLKDAWSDFFKELDKAPTATSKVEVAFWTLVGDLAKFFGEDLPEAIGIFWERLDSDTQDGVKIFGATFVGGLIGMLTQVGPTFYAQAKHAGQEWLRGINESVSAMVSGALQGGRNVVNGLVKGIREMASAPVEAISDVGKAILAKLKGVFKSASPSKAAIDIVQTVPQGAVVALERGTKSVTDAAGGMADGMLGRIGSRLGPSFSLPGGSGPRNDVASSISAVVHNQINVDARGAPGATTRDTVRNGVTQATGESTKALLAALETVAP